MEIISAEAALVMVGANKMAEMDGNRISAQNIGKTALTAKSGTKSGALSIDSLEYDLQAVVECWPELTAETRANVLALLAADTDSRKTTVDKNVKRPLLSRIV
jgi:hypothetical protein